MKKFNLNWWGIVFSRLKGRTAGPLAELAGVVTFKIGANETICLAGLIAVSTDGVGGCLGIIKFEIVGFKGYFGGII
jgi:hypothetical protein